MRRIVVVVSVGFALMAILLVVTLSGSPVAVAGVNTATESSVGGPSTKTEACQGGETLPAGTTGIRLRVFSFTGPRVTVRMLSHGSVIAHGEVGSGWTGAVVNVPVKPLPVERTGLTLCFGIFLNGYETNYLTGEPTPPARAAKGPEGTLGGRLRVEYMRPGHTSWWSIATEVARRIGLGRGAAGTWWVLLGIAFMVGAVALSSRLVLRELE
jgi:hypothetical protein